MSTDASKIEQVILNLLNCAIQITPTGTIKIISTLSTRNVAEVKVFGQASEISESYFESCENYDLDSKFHVANTILKKIVDCSIVGIADRSSKYVIKFSIDSKQTNRGTTMRSKQTFTWNEDVIEILLLESDPVNRYIISTQLDSKNFNLYEFSDIKEAIETIIARDRLNKPIKSLILDLNFPGIKGWEVAKEIWKMCQDKIIKEMPSIIGVASYITNEDIRKCIKSGFIKILEKPTKKSDLMEVLKLI